MMKPIFIKSVAVCCPDTDLLAQLQISGSAIDKALIPAAMRRRTSMTTRMAITAATQACQQAAVDTARLPSIFASLGGEIQVTDALCRLLPDDDALLSPTQFHNSVHNTTAGYWSILNKCQAATTAIAAADDTFAMGLLEMCSQLQLQDGDGLLVCYDELWPQYLAAPIGKVAFACAFVLSSHAENALASVTLPHVANDLTVMSLECMELAQSAPATAVLPLLRALQSKTSANVPLNISSPIWLTRIASKRD
jgi:hypothetical protein